MTLVSLSLNTFQERNGNEIILIRKKKCARKEASKEILPHLKNGNRSIIVLPGPLR